MSNIKYSDYDFEQITSKNYETLCSIFLKVAKNDKIKDAMKRYFI